MSLFYYTIYLCQSISITIYIFKVYFGHIFSPAQKLHFSNTYIHQTIYIVKVYSFIICLIYIEQNETKLALSNVEIHA